MKNLFTFIFLLFLPAFIYSQNQSNRFVEGKVICTQIGSGTNNFTVSCNFTDEGGLYDGTNIQIGDKLYFTDGGYGYFLPIDSIISLGPSTVVVRVSSTGTGLGAIPNSIGFISSSTEHFGLFPFVSGISNADQQINSENTFYKIDSVLFYRLPERISGSVPPAYTPASDQAWIAQSNGDGKLYRYDPVNTEWLEIGGLDTLNGIYSGSDTIPSLVTARIDSVFELISLDKDGYFLVQYGDLAGGRLHINDSLARLYHSDVAGNNEVIISSNGIRILANTNGPDDIMLEGSILLNKVLSPSSISTNQNNYSPTGLTRSNFVRLSSSANIDITGLGTGNGRVGRILALHNVGSFKITLKNNSGSSLSANRFALTNDYPLSPNDVVLLQYDTTSTKWRIFGTPRQCVDSLSMSGGTLRISLYDDNRPHTELNITENIQDIVGAMIGTQTNISVTYNDGTGKINYIAAGGGGGGSGSATVDTFDIFNDDLYLSFLLDSVPASVVDLSVYRQTQDTFFILSDTLYSSLSNDNVPSKFVSLTKYLQTIDTFRVNSGNIELSLTNDSQPVKTIAITTIAPVQSIIAGTGINVSGTNNITITNSSPDQTVSITNGGGVNVTGTYPNFTLTAVDQSITNEIQQIDTFFINGTIISNSLSSDGVPAKTLNIANALATSGADSTWVLINGSYLNKRIISNITRGGTTTLYGNGGSSTDTVGVFNISQGINSTKPAIHIDGNGVQILQIDADTRGDSIPDFRIYRTWFDNASTSGDNEVIRMGINTGPSGERLDTTKPKMALEFEYKYSYPGNNNPSFELHIPDILWKNQGGAGVRPLSGLFGHKRSFGGYWSMNSDRIFFGDYGGVAKAYWNMYPSSSYTKGITFLDTSTIVFDYPQVGRSYIRGKNAANTTSIEILQMDASNRIVFPRSVNSIYTYAPKILANTLLTIATADGNPLQVGDVTNKTNLAIYAPSTEVVSYQSNTGGSNVWRNYVNSDNFVNALPSGSNYLQVYTNAPSAIWANSRWGWGQSPGARFSIRQDGDAGGNGIQLTNSAASHSWYQALNSSGEYVWYQSGGQQRMKLDQGGFLLLGQSGSPSARLHVSTGAAVTTAITRLENTADQMDLFVSSATPESAITGAPGDFAYTNISSTGRWFGKRTGTGNTGWVEFYHTGNLPATPTTFYTGDGTITNRTVEVDGILEFSDADDDAEITISTGTLAGASLSMNNVESSLYYYDVAGVNGVTSDANSVGLTTSSGTDFVKINSASYFEIIADSTTLTSVQGVSTLSGILGFNGNNTIKQLEGNADGDVLTWNNSTSRWESQPPSGGPGSSGVNIYNSDGNLQNGGSQMLMDTLGETLRFVSDLPGTTTREMLRLSTLDDATTRFFVLTSPTDSLRIFRQASVRQYGLQTFGGTSLLMASDSIIKLSGDSLLVTEDIVPISNKVRFLTGLTDQYYMKRIDGNAANNGDILVSDGTDWVVTALSTAVGSNMFLQNGNTFGTTATLGTNDNNPLVFEVNNVNRLSLNTDYSITATASIANTNTAFDNLIIRNNSTGTPTTGFGTGLAFYGESSTTDNRFMGSFATIWSNATDGAQTSNFGIYISNAGSAAQGFTVFGATNPYATFGSGTTQYANAGITPGTTYIIGGNANTVTLGNSNGTVNIGNSNGTVNIGGSSASGTLNMFTAATSTNSINIYNTANAATSTAGIVFGNSTSYTQTSGTRTYVSLNSGFAPTSGTAIHNSMAFTGTFNQTGGANGVTRGIHINHTLTAVADYRAIDISSNEADAKGIYQTGSSTTNNFVGRTMFGSTSTPSSVAAVEISSTTQGFLLPRMTTTQRDAITAVAGLVIFNTTTTKMECYDGTTWQAAW